jgi:hypothetical protein
MASIDARIDRADGKAQHNSPVADERRSANNPIAQDALQRLVPGVRG